MTPLVTSLQYNTGFDTVKVMSTTRPCSRLKILQHEVCAERRSNYKEPNRYLGTSCFNVGSLLTMVETHKI